MRDRSEHSEMCPWVIGGECDCKKITVEIPTSNQLTTALARAERAERERDTAMWAVGEKDKQILELTAHVERVENTAAENEKARKAAFSYEISERERQIQTLETRNRQLVQAMGEAVKALNLIASYSCVANMAMETPRDEALLMFAANLGQCEMEASKALALLKEMGKE